MVFLIAMVTWTLGVVLRSYYTRQILNQVSLIGENQVRNAFPSAAEGFRCCCTAVPSWCRSRVYGPVSMQAATPPAPPCGIYPWSGRGRSVLTAFQLVKGISNYSNSHVTFSLNCNRLSQYSIYKKAFHTTTHQINTSRRLEKSAPTQRVDFTLWHRNLKKKSIYRAGNLLTIP